MVGRNFDRFIAVARRADDHNVIRLDQRVRSIDTSIGLLLIPNSLHAAERSLKFILNDAEGSLLQQSKLLICVPGVASAGLTA